MGLLAPAVASASAITSGDQIKLTGSTGSLGGGAFSVVGLGAASGNNFLTFCLEINEFVSYNTPYYANIAMSAEAGGAGGPDPDPLDSKTAYLYSNFLNGTLGDFNGSTFDIDALQMAIWSIEQEIYFSGGLFKRSDNNAVIGNSALASRANNFVNLAAGASGYYGIAVMQLWQNNNGGVFSGNKQDQLIFVGGNPPVGVPDAFSTLFGLLLGVSLLGAARRQLGA
jgi:hypothetical protein